MTFAIAVPDATPVFTDWPAECKRQVTEEISKAGSEAKILLMVGGRVVDIEYLVGRCDLTGDACCCDDQSYDKNKNRMNFFYQIGSGLANDGVATGPWPVPVSLGLTVCCTGRTLRRWNPILQLFLFRLPAFPDHFSQYWCWRWCWTRSLAISHGCFHAFPIRWSGLAI